MSDSRYRQHEFKKAENLLKVGAVCGGISLIIGGVLLSTAGLVCVLIGTARIRQLENALQNPKTDEMIRLRMLTKMRNVALVVCVATLLMNIYAVWQLWPMLSEVINTGSLESVEQLYGLGEGSLSNGAAGGSSSSGNSSSTWG